MKIWLNEKNEFVSLNIDQIKSLNEDDRALYVEAKEIELKRVHSELEAKNNTLKSELDALEVKHNEELDSLKTQLRELAEKQTNLNIKKEMGILEQLQAKQSEIIEALEQKKPFSLELDLKAVSNQTTSYTISNGNHIYNPQFMGIVSLPYRPNVILESVGKGSTSSRTVTWVEETLKEGSFAMGAEEGAIPLTSEKYTEATIGSKKAFGMKKLTSEQIKDLPQLTSLILNNLKRDHDKMLDSQILSGDGTGENIKGILEYAQGVVVAAPFLDGVDTPNLLDVIICANNQIEVTSEGQYSANIVVLNPADFNLFKTLKDETGQYIYPELATAGTLDGKRVATSTEITQGDFLLMDTSYANLLNYVPFSIEFGTENDDFSKDRITVRGISRNIFYIAEEHKKAFIYDTISTIASAIAKP